MTKKEAQQWVGFTTISNYLYFLFCIVSERKVAVLKLFRFYIEDILHFPNTMTQPSFVQDHSYYDEFNCSACGNINIVLSVIPFAKK